MQLNLDLNPSEERTPWCLTGLEEPPCDGWWEVADRYDADGSRIFEKQPTRRYWHSSIGMFSSPGNQGVINASEVDVQPVYAWRGLRNCPKNEQTCSAEAQVESSQLVVRKRVRLIRD